MAAPDLVPLRCPTCTTEFDVSNLAPGARTFCPKCRTIVTVPGPVSAAAPEPPPPPAPAPEPAAAKPRPQTFRPPTRRAPVAPPARPGRGLAVAALVLGLLSWFVPLLGFFAALVGLLALRNLDPKQGRGSAWAGVACGALSMILHGVLLFTVALPNYERITCVSRVSKIRAALDSYRAKHGAAPASLRDLVAAKLIDAQDLDCPGRRDSGSPAYVLFPPDVAQSSGILVAERGDYHGTEGRRVLTVGGKVETRSALELVVLPGMEPPSTKGAAPLRFEKRVVLEVQAKSWRGTPALDLARTLQAALAEQGVETVSAGTTADAIVEVQYDEVRGPLYTSGAHATRIQMSLNVHAPDRSQKFLTLHAVGSAPPVLHVDGGVSEDLLSRMALEEFRKSPGFQQAAPLAAAAAGSRKPLAGLVDALLRRETRDVTLDVMDRAGYRPTDPRIGAAMGAAREEFAECAKAGKGAVDVLVQAFREYSDYDRSMMARTLGELGDPRGAAPLEEYLRSAHPSEEDPRTLIAVVDALGRIGGESSLNVVGRFSDSTFPDLASAAERAIKALQSRSSAK